jgi:hypothetical protein
MKNSEIRKDLLNRYMKMIEELLVLKARYEFNELPVASDFRIKKEELVGIRSTIYLLQDLVEQMEDEMVGPDHE